MSQETIVKLSIRGHFNRRFDHEEFSTNKYRPVWNTPTDQGYTYKDFGLDLVRDVESKYQTLFQSQAMLLIADRIQQLEQDIKDLGDLLEQRMIKEAIDQIPEITKETA